MNGDKVKSFYLNRKSDITGTSGVGIVAYGAILPSGKVVMEWVSYHSSLNIFDNIEHITQIHGHEGATEVIMGEPKPKRKKRNE